MKTFYTTVSAAVLAFCLSAPAGAVDLSHPGYGDAMDTTNLTITENGQTRAFTLDYGMIEYNVCHNECTIQPQGGKAVTASGGDMVEISGSSAKVYKFGANPQVAQLPTTEDENRDSSDALAAPDLSTGDDSGAEDGDPGANDSNN